MNSPLGNSDDDYYRIETEYDYEYEDVSVFMFQSCVWSTVVQLAHSIYPVLFVSLFLVVFSFNNVSIKRLNILNSSLSLLVLIYAYNPLLVAYLLAFVIKIYLILNLTNFSQTKHAVIIVICSTIHMFMGRVLLFSASDWNSIKGVEMILIMKIISLVIDSKTNATQLNLTDLVSYLLSINTAMFGPWVSYADHLASLGHKVNRKVLNLFEPIKSVCISISCLVASNCLFNFIEHYLNINPLVRIYFEALSFRLSNYFVSYLSQAIVNFTGNSKIKVTRPAFIELPRSLLDVVTNWNVPIHNWLKTYVFKPMKCWRPNQSLLAVLVTYFVSSMLHAFDENISLILFSLGFYTYVEFGLRRNVSKLASCCVQARKCANGCSHRFKAYHPISLVFNLLFSLVNIYHLAYLGQVLFHVNSGGSGEVSGYEIAFKKWSATYYSSHLISILYFLLFKLTSLFC